MAFFDFLGGGQLKGDSGTGALFARLLDSIGNSVSQRHRSTLQDTQEYLMVGARNDEYATALRSDRNGNLLIGNYNPEIIESFEGATINAQRWVVISATFVPSLATIQGYNHNPTNITAISAGTILQSTRIMYKMLRVPLQIKRRFRHSLLAGAVHDFGFGIPSGLTTLIVPNGACFRFSTSGVVQGVITYNGAESAISNIIAQSTLGGNVIGAPLTMAAMTSGYYTYDIIVDDDNVLFVIQDTETGLMVGSLILNVPTTFAKMWGATGLPYYERTFHSAAVVQASLVITTEIQCLSTDLNLQLDAAQMAASLGLSGERHPFTGIQLGNHANSTAPASATLSNTTGGYGTSVKDGKWQFAAVAGANTDYALFGFQVPLGARFLIEGVRIEARNTVAAVAGTPTTLEWSLGVNGTGVSLVTANILRTQLGVQSFPVGAAAEAVAPAIDIDFKVPQVCESGRFIQLILTIPVGTATATEVFRGQYVLKGRFF
jgi:hypothetical protein